VVEIRWAFPLGDEDIEIIGWSAVIEKKILHDFATPCNVAASAPAPVWLIGYGISNMVITQAI
jgi:hypothetical protein